MLYSLFKKVAFSMDAEFAHESSIQFLSKFPLMALSSLGQIKKDKRFCVGTPIGSWPFPIGLAAGLDKNAKCIPYFGQLGFGAVEVGTVTPRPQPGNDRPRLFRIPEKLSLRNRMGFNNEGADYVYSQVSAQKKRDCLIGVNLGKNKWTQGEDSINDYRVLFEKFALVADYLVINVSSPNTPGLRDLQKKDELVRIFEALKDLRKKYKVPLLLKISPDCVREDIEQIVETSFEYKLDGLIATNTTFMPEIGDGGISGKILKEKATMVRQWVCEMISNRRDDFLFIGVGGVSSYDDLITFWKQGGKCMQIYSSFIYQGPQVLFDIRDAILKDLVDRNCQNVEQLIESYYSN